MSEKGIENLSIKEEGSAAAPAPAAAPAAPFQFNFASSVPPAGGAAPASGASPFQFNFSAGNAAGQFAFQPKSEGAELAEPEDDEENHGVDEDDIIKEALAELPSWSKVRVLNLLAISKVRDQLRAEYRAEVRDLLRKYEKLTDALDAKRAAIIGGAAIVDAPSDEAKASLAKLGDADASRPIEKFWFKTLSQSSRIASSIHEQDEPVLEYLTDIRASSLEEGVGFRLEFEFRENPFFTNKVLTKVYREEDGEEPVLVAIEGTEIAWNAGKNTCVKVVKKTQKSGKKGGKQQKKTVMATEKCDSFFNFFESLKVPTEEDEKTMDDEELQDREMEIESDYNIGLTIRQGIVPDAVSFFLGVADDEEDEGWNFGEDGEEYGEDDEDEDEDEDDEPQPRGRGGRHGGGGGGPIRGGRGGAGRGQNPQECKQQ